ncbi:hypothetical protein CC86DRAFT_408539 [Ophiobolus disseminans]|uniref:N-acetyltransferase domain-containing protein n=1 Tax=Ophiobolus disseminans TaxID=1469910 RepID=A0A6A6ZUD8_9PLEO|nr:hypothetical protein CC86DRAFT_408539 [Ophiobolus disseminans]
MAPMAPSDVRYTIIRFPPASPHIAELVAKFRDTKLAALKNDPGSFVQRYDIESLLPLSIWHDRLASVSTLLICVENSGPEPHSKETLLMGKWVGIAAAMGPVDHKSYHTAFSAAIPPEPISPDVEARWHVYDLYVTPNHRGRGIANMLRDNLLAILAQNTLALGMQKARLRLIVNPKTTWLVEEYRLSGFVDHVRVSLKEGFMASGWHDSVPGDTGSTEQLRTMWDTRIGLAMEKIMDVA